MDKPIDEFIDGNEPIDKSTTESKSEQIDIKVEMPKVTITNTEGNQAEATKTSRPRKQWIPQPQFERFTRSKKVNTQNEAQVNTAFYAAFAAGASHSIYDDPETI